MNKLSAMMMTLSLCAAGVFAQATPDSVRTLDSAVASDSTGLQNAEGTALPPSTAPDFSANPSPPSDADELEKNRQLALSLDSTVAAHKRYRGAAIGGMVVGGVITVVGAVMAQMAAQEEAEERAQDNPGTVQTAIGVNFIGLLIGIPITAISTAVFIKSTVKLNKAARQKSRLKLTLAPHPNGLALHF